MSDGFLGRWSRRKHAAQAEAAPAELPPVPEIPELELPPVETLDAASDYTAFLQKGVSAAIQQQALRRAWESDASIASFRGMADYDWDFNAPTYGRLWATDDVAKLLRDVLASPPAPKPEPEPEPKPEPEPERLPEPLVAEARPIPAPPSEPAAPEVSGPAVPEAAPPPHRHGSAMPC